MPTSKIRSGNSFAKGSNPVGPCIAAVRATISGRDLAISTISSEKIDVHDVTDFASDTPVAGSTTPTAWNFSASSMIAGAWPRPFSVITCTKTGAPKSFASARALSIAAMLCPSTGPIYFNPRSSNMPCGATISLMPFFTPCNVS